jgi:hypothetical protein
MPKPRMIPKFNKKKNPEISQCLLIVIVLMFANNFLVNRLRHFRKSWTSLEMIPENIVTIIVGLLFGLFLRFAHAQNITSTLLQSFEPIFMIVLLPPILYSSALKMNKYFFFKNFGCICLYAFLGTLLAILSNTLMMFTLAHFNIGPPFPFHYCLVFSSIISATDPVSVLSAFEGRSSDPNLYSLIFGESILNDAISLSFFRAINFDSAMEEQNEVDFILSTLGQFSTIIIVSLIIGVVTGLFGSFILKGLHKWTLKTQNSLHEKTGFIYALSMYSDEECRDLEKSKLSTYSQNENKGENKVVTETAKKHIIIADYEEHSDVIDAENESSENTNKHNISSDNLLAQNDLYELQGRPIANDLHSPGLPPERLYSILREQKINVDIIGNSLNENSRQSTELRSSTLSTAHLDKSQTNEVANLRQKLEQYTNQEISIMLTMPIVSYLIAEVFLKEFSIFRDRFDFILRDISIEVWHSEP